MPTAARLTGALFFALLAWGVSQMLLPTIPREIASGHMLDWFAERNALYGFTWGWALNSQRANATAKRSLSNGFTTVITVVLWAVTSTAISQMLHLSLKKRYHGVGEAFQGTIEFTISNLRLLATPEIVGTFMVGAVVGGALCGWVARRWK